MKKILLFWLFMLALMIDVQGQTRTGLGVHVGTAHVGTYRLSDDNIDKSIEEKNAIGFQVGLGYNLKIGPVGFTPELNIVHFKYRYNSEENGTDNSRYYLALPLLFKWYLGPLNLHVGPQFSYLFGGRWGEDKGECVLDQCVNVNKGDDVVRINLYRKTDFSGVFGVGIDTKIGIYASLRTVLSITPIVSKESYENIDDFKTTTLERYVSGQLFIGYRF